MIAYPLVSVVIVTYNSSNFILEALESVFEQDYPQIELIVTDDCSKDNTVELVEEWISRHECKFVRTELIVSPQNTGIPANCNRGVKACQGEWVRLSAGDDLLAPQSISKQIDFANKTGSEAFVGHVMSFVDKNGKRVFIDKGHHINNAPWFFESDSNYQYNYLLRHYDFGLGLGTLFKKSIYDKISLYDERYPYEEDTLFQLNITKRGVRFSYIREPIVYYRLHDSVSHTCSEELLNRKYEDSKKGVKRDHIYPHIPWYDIIYWESEAIESLIYYLVFNVFDNQANSFNERVICVLNKLKMLRYANYLIGKYEMKKWKKKNNKKVCK